MAAVPAFAKAAAKRGGSHAVITRRQSSFLRPRISSAARTAIARGVAPTYPVGLMGIVIVRQNKLRSGNQVVSPDHRIGDRPRGISQGHLIIDSQSGPRSAGQKPEDRAQSCDSERKLHLVTPSTKKECTTFAKHPERNRLPNSVPTVR